MLIAQRDDPEVETWMWVGLPLRCFEVAIMLQRL